MSSVENIPVERFSELLLNGVPLIDVRAPVEFAQGALPGAVNLPLLTDEERAQVGTIYKQKGNVAAVELGHLLVSGATKEARLQAWIQQVKNSPASVLYCFRGGLRSQTTQGWLQEAGFPRPLLLGGYKQARRFLMQEISDFSETCESLVLSGPTGSAKTSLINKAAAFYPSVDLEGMAEHRGSAFGAMTPQQPSQPQFENLLAVQLLKNRAQKPGLRPLFEDESRLIGRCVVPDALFANMRRSQVFYVEESFDQRVQNIFDDYITTSAIGTGSEEAAIAVFAKYLASTRAISRRLGGVRTDEVLQDLAHSQSEYLAGRGLESNRAWIARLLKYYYDPLYKDSFQRRNPEITFRGNGQAILDRLRSLRA
jgi:tRNA 2-selenouridine synthase